MICKKTGCTIKKVARGFCKTHYYAWRRTDEALQIFPHCNIDNCLKPIYSKGLCHKHHHRLQRGNDPQSPTIWDDRPAISSGDFSKIQLGAGGKKGLALVDNDMVSLSSHRWHVDVDGYASNKALGKMQNIVFTKKHGAIPLGLVVDHKNRDRLDNRISNLRLATKQQNLMNRCQSSINKSGYKGVYANKNRKRWCATIQKDGASYFIGTFDTTELAATAYNKKAEELFGEFAYLNQV